jgi:hypothetical protein
MDNRTEEASRLNSLSLPTHGPYKPFSMHPKRIWRSTRVVMNNGTGEASRLDSISMPTHGPYKPFSKFGKLPRPGKSEPRYR